MTFAGLKKWCPMTICGRVVADAISSILSVEVFDARMQSGFAILSNSLKICFLSAIPSKTASTIMSACSKPS